MPDFNSESIDILFEAVKDEYNQERQQTSSIDTKVSISLPILSAFFLAVSKECDFCIIYTLSANTFCECFVGILFVFLLLATPFFSAYATLSAIRAIWPRSYTTLPIADYYSKQYLTESSTVIKLSMIYILLEKTIIQNRAANNLKMRYYTDGWLYGVCSAIFFVLYNLIYTIITRSV